MTTDVLDHADVAPDDEERQFVTLTVADQLCGVPALGVRDILGEQAITRIPLAPEEVAGSLNLRGRIVTAIDLRRRLGLPPAPRGTRRMEVVAEHGGELYALLIDQVSELMCVTAGAFERNPPTLAASWARFATGIYRLEGRLLVVLDVAKPLAPGEPGRTSMTHSCLVVDESRVVRKVARRILEGHGFAVREAEDGQKALELCGQALPDCVLLERNMPVMNGIEFLKALRAKYGPGRPSVVFCTTETAMSFIEQAIEYGAQEFIMKPFDEEILIGKFAQVGVL
jgi:chemotaxis signal transduction protein/CheY-like chemotaxis protein